MRFKDAIRWVKEKITGKKRRQETQEGEELEEMNISAQTEKKGLDGTEDEATDGEKAGGAFRDFLDNCNPIEKGQKEELEKVAANLALKCGMSVDEAGYELKKIMFSFSQAWQSVADSVRRIREELYFSSMDKWQREKLKMSNNERRRRGVPMVRRRQHLKNEKKQRYKRHE